MAETMTRPAAAKRAAQLRGHAYVKLEEVEVLYLLDRERTRCGVEATQVAALQVESAMTIGTALADLKRQAGGAS